MKDLSHLNCCLHDLSGLWRILLYTSSHNSIIIIYQDNIMQASWWSGAKVSTDQPKGRLFKSHLNILDI